MKNNEQVILDVNIVIAQKLTFFIISIVIPEISPLFKDSWTNTKIINTTN
jgi:hypothetical protein